MLGSSAEEMHIGTDPFVQAVKVGLASARAVTLRMFVASGRYPLHHGINDWIPPSSAYGMPLNETTIADHFKTAGFKTHAIGKSKWPVSACGCK
eukprot:SAG31_NODE_2856_length_4992_cov_2.079910_5_plen_94_part_00